MKCPLAFLCLLGLILAACDAMVPEAPLPETTATASTVPGTNKGQGSDRENQWAFPYEIEKSRIVFGTLDLTNGYWSFHKINADGSGLQPFDFDRVNPDDPEFPDIVFHAFRWSPDGRQLVYRGSNTNTDNWYLVLIDSTGTGRRRLTDLGGFVDDPSWSPKGDRILYGQGGIFGGQLGVIVQTSIVDTLGNSFDFFVSEESLVFEGDSLFFSLFDEGGGGLYDAEWAPGGDHLYMTGTLGKRRDAGDVSASDVEIFKVEVATGRVVERITHNDIDETGFILSPDGQRALLRRREGSNFYTYLLNLGDGVLVGPVIYDAVENPPRWAADSRHVLYEQHSGVYLFDVTAPETDRRITDGYFADIFMGDNLNTGIERPH